MMSGYLDPPPGPVFWLIPLLVSGAIALAKDRFGGPFGAAAVAAIVATLLYVVFVVATVGYSPTGTTLAAVFTLLLYSLICGAAVALVSFAANGLCRRR